MKRIEIVNSLIKEGFSEKTLVKFSDKQLTQLHKRIVGEATTKQVRVLSMNNTSDAEEVNNLINNPEAVADMKAKGPIEVTKEEKTKDLGESLTGLMIAMVTKKLKEKLGRDPKDEEIEKELDKMSKRHKEKNKFEKKKKEDDKKEDDKKEVKEWVKNLAENNYHSFTSKGEIMELIQSKSLETSHGSKVKKGHNGVPEFMTYDSIVSAAEPKEKPGTKEAPVKDPGTKQPPKKDPRKDPLQPNPGKNPKPKASINEKK